MPKTEVVKVGMEESFGSDSNPSEDNLEDGILTTIMISTKRTKCIITHSSLKNIY
jgi:hypothetical protein